MTFLEKLVPEYLLTTTKDSQLKLGRAHRSSATKPGPNQCPRPLILRFHNFRDKQRAKEAAHQLGSRESNQDDSSPREPKSPIHTGVWMRGQCANSAPPSQWESLWRKPFTELNGCVYFADRTNLVQGIIILDGSRSCTVILKLPLWLMGSDQMASLYTEEQGRGVPYLLSCLPWIMNLWQRP